MRGGPTPPGLVGGGVSGRAAPPPSLACGWGGGVSTAASADAHICALTAEDILIEHSSNAAGADCHGRFTLALTADLHGCIGRARLTKSQKRFHSRVGN